MLVKSIYKQFCIRHGECSLLASTSHLLVFFPKESTTKRLSNVMQNFNMVTKFRYLYRVVEKDEETCNLWSQRNTCSSFVYWPNTCGGQWRKHTKLCETICLTMVDLSGKGLLWNWKKLQTWLVKMFSTHLIAYNKGTRITKFRYLCAFILVPLLYAILFWKLHSYEMKLILKSKTPKVYGTKSTSRWCQID